MGPGMNFLQGFDGHLGVYLGGHGVAEEVT
jgi:hypothetical protein